LVNCVQEVEMAKRKISEMRFDLESVRQVKRQLNRTLRYLVAIEKGMVKFKKSENERKAESKRKKKRGEHQDADGVWHNLDLGEPPMKTSEPGIDLRKELRAIAAGEPWPS